MNTKRLQYFLLGLLVTIAGSVAADSIFGGGGSGGGAATSITTNSTTVTGGTDTAVCYEDGTKIRCDATSPMWTKGTTTLSWNSLGTGFTADTSDQRYFYLMSGARIHHDAEVVPLGGPGGALSYTNFYGPQQETDTDFANLNVNGADRPGLSLENLPRTTSFGSNSPNGLVFFSAGPLRLGSGGSATTNERWNIAAANPGSLLAVTDGGPDIGASGANRPNNAYVKTDVIINGNSVVTALAKPRATFGGQTGLGVLGATMLGGMYKPTAGVTLTRISGQVLLAGTCAACGVTDTTFRVTDGSTNSDCANGSAVTCTSAAGTKFSCTPSNTGRAANQELTVETVAVGGTCTTAPIVALTVEYGMQ